MKAIFSLVAVAAVGWGGWYGYRSLTDGDTEAVFITAQVDRGDILATVTATGTVEPTIRVLVGSQVSGTVVKWYADFNHAVKAGQILLELDQDRFKTALQQRVAAVRTAEARLIEAQVRAKDATRERKRIEELFGRRAASENEFQIVQAAEESAAAAVQAAEADLEARRAEKDAAEVDLSKTVIASPIDGVVISRDVDEGQTVAASLQTPQLFAIAADLKKMRVQANVSESDIGRIREGMAAGFTVDAYPDNKFRGVVSQVRYNPTIVDNVVTYVTLVDVENPDLLLRPGMTANITFETARIDKALRVPNTALRFNPEPPPQISDNRPRAPRVVEGPRVFALIDGKPKPVPVEIGLTDGTFTQIQNGALAEGQPIIVDRRWSGGGPTRTASRLPRSL